MPYTFKWSNGAISKDLAGLDAGTYTVTVTDKNKCTATAVVDVLLINYEIYISDVAPPTSCNNHLLNPTITYFLPDGGFSSDLLPFSFKWSTGATTANINVQSSGNYCVTVTSANLCSSSKCFEVSLVPSMALTTAPNTNCPIPPGNGVISVNAIGGTPPYKYSYNPGPQNTSNSSLSDLSPGSYNVVVSDVNGCKSSKFVQVEHSKVLNVSIEKTDACEGSNVGQVKIKLPFVNDYRMNLYKVDQNGNRVLYETQGSSTTTFTINNLAIGLYFVEVLDVDNCDYGYKTFEIKQSQNPSITDIIASTHCILTNEAEASPGKITINSVIGGSQPFTYKWSTYDNTKDITVNTPGVYTVTVTDKNGCYYNKSFEVKSTDQTLFANVEVINTNGCDSKIVELDVKIDILSGNPPYKIVLNEISYNLNSNNATYKIKVPKNAWPSFWMYLSITDNCGLKLNKNQSILCFDICPDCTSIEIKNTGIGGCVKVADGAQFGWVWPSKFVAVSSCPSSNLITFFDEGGNQDVKIQGAGKKEFLNDIPFDGWKPFTITNNTTGCLKRDFILTKKCRSAIKWIFNIFKTGGGGGGGGGSGPTDCQTQELEFIGFDWETCEERFICPRTGEEERKQKPIETCFIKCDNNYAIIDYCPLTCHGSLVISNSESNKNKKECPPCLTVQTNCIVSPGRVDFDPPSCEANVKDVIADSTESRFIMFWNEIDSLNRKLLKGYYFKNSRAKADFGAYSMFPTNLDIKSVRIDTNKNHYILGENGNNYFQKSNKTGDVNWSLNLLDFDVKFVSDGNTGQYNLIGFDLSKNKWLSKTISINGAIIIERELNLPDVSFEQIFQLQDVTYAYQKATSSLVISTNSSNVIKDLPANIEVKKISKYGNDQILLACEYIGQVSMLGSTFNSYSYKNLLFIIIDSQGNLLKVKNVNHSDNMTVNSMAILDVSDITIIGNITDVSFGPTPEQTIIDSCNYVKLFDLKDPCITFTSTLTYDLHQCQLSWEEAPAGYTTMLQMEINGVWMPVQKAVGVDVAIVSPYTIIRDGKYSLVSSKDGCPDVLSNEVNTSCTSGCACSIPNLGYDQAACTLTWTLTGCVGYTPSLQKLNSNNVWETIVQQATSPFNIITNGSYRLSVSKGMNTIGNACPTVLSNTVTTSCTPFSNACSCAPATLSHNTASCSLSWTASSCTGYTTALQRNIAGVWTTINASSPYTIPANSNGSYRIVSSKSGCTDLLSNVVNVTCSCSSPASITIFDYGTSGLGQNATILKGQSYTHEVSQGSPDACDESFIQLAFASSVVNSSWTFYVNGSVAVMPGTVIGSQYVVDLYLPTPPSGGTADVFMQSPCGDFYQLHLVYDCEPECVYIPCQSFTIMDDCINLNLVEVGNLSHSVSGSWVLINGCFSQSALQLASNIRNKIIEMYPYCNANNLEVYFTKEDGVGLFLVIENAPMDIVSINYNSINSQDIGYCPPLNCTCPDLAVSIEGGTTYSCENLTINASNGTAPYTYVITGTGTSGTQINQSGSSNIINLNALQQNESINLNIQVLDANGCEYSTLTPYSRCNNACLMGPLGKMECVCGTLNHVNISTDGCGYASVAHNCYGSGYSQNSPYYIFDSQGNELGSFEGYEINSFLASTGNGVYYMQVLCGCGFTNSKQFTINCPDYSNGQGSSQRLSSTKDPKNDIIRFYPNPFSKGINLELTSDNAESLDIEVYNNLGLQVFTKTLDLEEGINLRYIEEFENVPSGVYIVKIKSDTKDHTSRVIKVE